MTQQWAFQYELRDLGRPYRTNIATKRLVRPLAEPLKGRILAAAALEGVEEAADPVAVEADEDDEREVTLAPEPEPVAVAVFDTTVPEDPLAGPTVWEVGK